MFVHMHYLHAQYFLKKIQNDNIEIEIMHFLTRTDCKKLYSIIIATEYRHCY